MNVIFSRSHTASSLLIRLMTWSRWSHCGVILNGQVIHSTASKWVHSESLESFKRNCDSWEVAEMPGDASLALPLIGKKYDWGGVFGHWFGAWGDPERWFCSELVAYCSGMFRKGRSNRVTPEHIFMVSK